MNNQRKDVEFFSDTAICRAWLYEPDASADGLKPCIVMAPGLGGTRDSGLEPFALKFANAGYYVLLFDYRHFGVSDGEPRQLCSVKRQLKDWANAIGYVRSLSDIDPVKIALWGFSLSGGHVIVTAARDGQIAAISAQAPAMDLRAAQFNYVRTAGLINSLKVSALGALDLLRTMLGMSPTYIPVTGSPQEHAVLCSTDAAKGYGAVTPPNWRNEICAHYVHTSSSYRPIVHASKLQCPALVQVCMQDNILPPKVTLKAVQKIGAKAELKQYECGHFDLFMDDYFEQASNEQLAFFNRALALD